MNRELNWVAIGAGAAIMVALSIAMLVVSHVVVPEIDSTAYRLIRIGGTIVGLIGHIGGGALAGWLGAPRGAMHGCMSSLVATGISWIISTAINVLRFGPELSYFSAPGYWASVLSGILVGTGVATLAGYLAAHARANMKSG
jgi:hypothetical protein